MSLRLVYILLFSLLIISCEDDDATSTVDFAYDYQPLSIGQESIFQVDSILYDDFSNTIDTLSFQRREFIASSFTNAEGVEVFRVEVSLRLADTLNWSIQKVITKQRDKFRYELFDDNIRTIPLVFPPVEDQSWDANLLNTKDEEDYQYVNVNVPFVLADSVPYESTLAVLQRSEENLIEVIATAERYARGVGLIYRRDVDLETELNGDIKSGYDVSLTLIAFNN